MDFCVLIYFHLIADNAIIYYRTDIPWTEKKNPVHHIGIIFKFCKNYTSIFLGYHKKLISERMFNKGKDSINGEIRKILKKFVTEHSET